MKMQDVDHLFRFGCAFRKCVIPIGLAKEPPPRLKTQNIWILEIGQWL